MKLDKKDKILLASLQGKTADQLLNKDEIPDSLILYKEGKLYFESDALIRVGQVLGGIFKLSAIFWIIPKKLRDAIYRFIARKRYKWFGKNENCRTPTVEERHKFLD